MRKLAPRGERILKDPIRQQPKNAFIPPRPHTSSKRVQHNSVKNRRCKQKSLLLNRNQSHPLEASAHYALKALNENGSKSPKNCDYTTLAPKIVMIQHWPQK
jgi:hypothetical protein